MVFKDCSTICTSLKKYPRQKESSGRCAINTLAKARIGEVVLKKKWKLSSSLDFGGFSRRLRWADYQNENWFARISGFFVMKFVTDRRTQLSFVEFWNYSPIVLKLIYFCWRYYKLLSEKAFHFRSTFLKLACRSYCDKTLWLISSVGFSCW